MRPGNPNKSHSGRESRRLWGLVVAASVMAGSLAACTESEDSSGGVGSVPSAAYDPASVEAGKKPDLPRTIAFAKPSDVEFEQTLEAGLEQAAEERDLELLVADANGDPATNVQQLSSFLTRGVGGIIAEPVDINAQRDVKTQAVRRASLSPPPGRTDNGSRSCGPVPDRQRALQSRGRVDQRECRRPS